MSGYAYPRYPHDLVDRRVSPAWLGPAPSHHFDRGYDRPAGFFAAHEAYAGPTLELSRRPPRVSSNGLRTRSPPAVVPPPPPLPADHLRYADAPRVPHPYELSPSLTQLPPAGRSPHVATCSPHAAPRSPRAADVSSRRRKYAELAEDRDGYKRMKLEGGGYAKRDDGPAAAGKHQRRDNAFALQPVSRSLQVCGVQRQSALLHPCHVLQCVAQGPSWGQGCGCASGWPARPVAGERWVVASVVVATVGSRSCSCQA